MIDFGYGVSLGTISKSQLEKLRKWRNHHEIWRWCRQNDLISEHDQDAWYSRIISDSTIKMYTISDHAQVVGVCGLTSIDLHNRRAEFSLYIGPEHQHKGHGRACLRSLLRHGFDNLGLNIIWGETFEGNHAYSMFESLGFLWEGTRRQFYYKAGNFVDAELYSVTREEFEHANITANTSDPNCVGSSN